MGRIVAWLVLIFMVLFALRVLAARSARNRRKATVPASQPMVRCTRCGVFLPRDEAKETGGSFVCAAGDCVSHG